MEAIDTSQILHAAEVMIQRYGEHAREQAAIRAKELSDIGDPEGAKVWQQVEVVLRTRLHRERVHSNLHH
jgi:hypothetical protein